MSSDETEPLLCDVESAEVFSRKDYKERLGRTMESPRWHTIIIILIAIDASIVLVDLSYNFLLSSCDPDGDTEANQPLWLEILGHLSLAITSLFLIEIPLNLFAFGRQYYNPSGRLPHARLHILDATVIIGTFVIEVFLKGRERELASLLVILRLWRLVKLVGGVAVGVGELNEEVEKRLIATETELAKTKAELEVANVQIETLRARIAQLNAKPSISSEE